MAERSRTLLLLIGVAMTALRVFQGDDGLRDDQLIPEVKNAALQFGADQATGEVTGYQFGATPALGSQSPGASKGGEISLADLYQKLVDTQVTISHLRMQSVQPGSASLEIPRGNPVYLRTCFEWLTDSVQWAKSTRNQYRREVDRWERYWAAKGQPHGPDVRDIKDGDFATWATDMKWEGRTAELYWTYFEKMLKAGLPRSKRLEFGRPKGEVILTELPVSGLKVKEVTREVWDIDISTDRLDVDHISKLMFAAEELAQWPESPSGLPPHLSWCGLFWLEWYCGPRMTNAVLMDLRCVDLRNMVLTYKESKRGKIIRVPLPLVIKPLFQTLKEAAAVEGRKTLFAFPAYCVGSPTHNLYLYMERFHAHAGFEPLQKSDGDNQWFHQFRKSSTSQWIATSPGLQRFFVGHKTGDVSDDYYARVLNEMRAAAEQYPVPDWLIRWNDQHGARPMPPVDARRLCD